jgi:hypothetical protein
LPALALWGVPFLLVALYVVRVGAFFHAEARWTSSGLGEIGLAVVVLFATLAYSLLWYAVAYAAALSVGAFLSLGVLVVLGKLPVFRRHVVIAVPNRPDTPREVRDRFGVLFLVALCFELLYLVILFQRGELSPRFAVSRPTSFFFDEAIAGLLLGIILAPAGPFLAGRLRRRIVDSLEFPFLRLTLLLLVVGGASLAVVVLLPRIELNPALFFLSILVYAPAAWFIAPGFSRAEVAAQNLFLARAGRRRGPSFHFGQLEVRETESRTSIRG